MISGVTDEHKEQTKKLILEQLEEFWKKSPDEQHVLIELPDGIAAMAEQACDWGCIRVPEDRNKSLFWGVRK